MTIAPVRGSATARPVPQRPESGEPVDIAVRRVAGWEVVFHAGRSGAAAVYPGAAKVAVVVTDQGAGLPIAQDTAMTAAQSPIWLWAHADGRVQARSSWAPPALLVRPGGTTMVPCRPGHPCIEQLDSGDRIVVLSCAAYEVAAQTMVDLFHAHPERLRAHDAAALLEAICSAAPDAAGAILTRV